MQLISKITFLVTKKCKTCLISIIINYVHGLKNEYENIFIINNKQIKFLKIEKFDIKLPHSI